MDVKVNPNISVLDQVKMQAQVLVPVLRALRAELGEERADRLVTSALREWLREGFQRLGARISGSPKDKFDALWAMGVSRIQEPVLALYWPHRTVSDRTRAGPG